LDFENFLGKIFISIYDDYGSISYEQKKLKLTTLGEISDLFTDYLKNGDIYKERKDIRINNLIRRDDIIINLNFTNSLNTIESAKMIHVHKISNYNSSNINLILPRNEKNESPFIKKNLEEITHSILDTGVELVIFGCNIFTINENRVDQHIIDYLKTLFIKKIIFIGKSENDFRTEKLIFSDKIPELNNCSDIVFLNSDKLVGDYEFVVEENETDISS